MQHRSNRATKGFERVTRALKTLLGSHFAKNTSETASFLHDFDSEDFYFERIEEKFECRKVLQRGCFRNHRDDERKLFFIFLLHFLDLKNFQCNIIVE
jgi:hypothetical protein